MAGAWERNLEARRRKQAIDTAARRYAMQTELRDWREYVPEPEPVVFERPSRFSLPTGTPLITPSGETPTTEDYRVAGQIAADMAAEMLFGQQRESVLPGSQPAGLLERFARTQAGEEEFRLAGQRAQEGRVGPAIGWGVLGLASVIPFAGDIAQGAGAASRAVSRVGAVSDSVRALEAAGELTIADAVRSLKAADHPENDLRRIRIQQDFDVESAMYGDTDISDAIQDSIAVTDAPDVVYHVAPRSARANIDRDGLRPRTWNTGAEQNQEWFDDALWERLGDDGELIPVEYRPEGIYLFENLEDAREYAKGGGDIYAVDLAGLRANDAQIIKDPTVAADWDNLESGKAYVTRTVPPSFTRRVEEVEGDALDSLIAAATAPTSPSTETLVDGLAVPTYQELRGGGSSDNIEHVSQLMINRQTLSDFLAERQRQELSRGLLHRPIKQYQEELIKDMSAAITDELSALAHWQYVGNNNVQSLLRTNGMPTNKAYRDAVEEIHAATGLPRSQIEMHFLTLASDSIPILDRLTDAHRNHGGIIVYRGIDGRSTTKAFGDDFRMAAFDDPDSLIGLTWTDDAFSASSLSATRAHGFASPREEWIWSHPDASQMLADDPELIKGPGVIMRLEIEDGVGAVPVSGYLDVMDSMYPGEYEVLLQRGLNFEITGVVSPWRIQQEAGIRTIIPIIHVRVTR